MVSATAAMVEEEEEEEEEVERVGEEEDLDRRFPNVSAALNRILKAAIFSLLLLLSGVKFLFCTSNPNPIQVDTGRW